MQITKDTVVQFSYVLKDEEGKVLENASQEGVTAYLHGHNNMMPGLEKELTGKQKGDEIITTLPPSETYGERQEGQEERISIKHLEGAKKWKTGMVAAYKTDQGYRPVTIIKAGKFMATVDLNHPLAGRTLTFEVNIVDVRVATAEEIAHGHAHGDGGHQH